MGTERAQGEVTPDYREEALRILEHCDPGDCGCGEPHKLPEGNEDLIDQMVELLKSTDNNEGK